MHRAQLAQRKGDLASVSAMQASAWESVLHWAGALYSTLVPPWGHPFRAPPLPQPALKFNGGGHLNHSMFWQMLCPPKVRAAHPLAAVHRPAGRGVLTDGTSRSTHAPRMLHSCSALLHTVTVFATRLSRSMSPRAARWSRRLRRSLGRWTLCRSSSMPRQRGCRWVGDRTECPQGRLHG